MIRRTVVTVILVILLLGTGVAPAFGWANGPRGSDGKIGNGVGSHDWILSRAMAIAGKDASWIDRVAAYRATDDPDTYGTNGLYHHYRETGSVRGAPYIVSDLYHKAVVAHDKGDYVAASKYLGTLSHYYTDICQPFHTTVDSNKYVSLHAEYEYDVDDYQHKTTNVTSWVTPATPVPLTDIRARTIAAAKFARSRYPALRDSFKVSHRVGTGTPNRVTREVQSRAANDLADIIRAIPKGTGQAPLPKRPTVTLTYTYPRQSQAVGAFVTCVDAAGKPMEGVGVKFTWRLPTGTKTSLMYTEADGKVHAYQNIGKSPLMQVKYFTAYVPASGECTSTSRWYKPTKVLDAGSAGFKGWVSNTRPYPGSSLTGYALARDTSGNPVPGLDVTFTWSLDGYSARTKAVTDSNGVARCTRVVENSRSGERAYFKAEVQAGGHNRSSAPSFIPY